MSVFPAVLHVKQHWYPWEGGTPTGLRMLHCCNILVTRHGLLAPPPMFLLPCGRKCVYSSIKGRCATEKVEKRQTDLANVTSGQVIREIGESITALLHSLRAKTRACFAGHCHGPDSGRCSGSVCPWICTPAHRFIQIFCSLSIHPFEAMCNENSELLIESAEVSGCWNSSNV